jgi:hypothetical protein
VKDLTAQQRMDRVWDAVVNQLEVDPEFDHDGAVKLADWAKAFISRGMQYDRDLVLARRREFWWSRITSVLLGFAAVVAVAVGIGAAIYFPVKEGANDYGGTDPGSVPAGAYFYIQQWYGLNDLPPGLQQVSETHGFYQGQKAWLTRWRSRDGRQVCAYVWGHSSTNGAPHNTYGKVVACP